MPMPVEVVNPGALDALDAGLDQEAGRKLIDGEKELIKRLRQEITQGRAHDKHARAKYADDRRVARGDTEWLVDTNLVNTIIEILLAFIYAKNPDISVGVADSVGESRAKEYKDATRTLEIVVSRLLKDAGMKRQAKRWVRSAMTVGVGWLKVAMQTRTDKDPIIENQLNDLKANLARIAVLKANLADGETCDEAGREAEIEANITAVQAKLEREIATGIAIDLFPAQDVQVSPECGELENYLQSPWINFRHYKTKEVTQALAGKTAEQLKGANVYHQRPRDPDKEADSSGAMGDTSTEWIRAQDTESESVAGFYCIDEMWSLRDGVVYTMIEGCNDWFARKPYAPNSSARFYDIFLLAFHYIDGERHPQSDVHQMKKLQNEYGRTRSNFAEHRKRSVPGTIVDGSQISPTEMDKIRKSETGEYTVIQPTNPGDDLRKAFASKQYPQFDPRLYDTQPILTDLEKVSGAQDAMQSGVQVEKTATEAEIQNNGFGARVGTRKDEVEDLLSEIAEHVAQLALLLLPQERVIQIAGKMAVWPTGMTIDDIQNGFNIEVRAGTTGKPNTAAQRAAWSTILPLIEKIITVIGNFRSQGPQMEWAAKPYVELLRETCLRLGDHTDIERFLPAPPPDQPAAAPPPPDPVELAKADELQDRGFMERAQGVAALAGVGLPPAAAQDEPAPGAGADPLQAILAAAKGGAAPAPAPGSAPPMQPVLSATPGAPAPAPAPTP